MSAGQRGMGTMRIVDVEYFGVEGCAGIDCGALLEVVPGWRVGAYRYHLSEPDLFCDDCVAKERPDLLLPDGVA